MGYSSYDNSARNVRSANLGYATKSAHEIFTQHETHEKMKPVGVDIREARDSEAHPNSVPVIIGLDETGSMGIVPHNLVKDGLPSMVSKILEAGLKDVAILFLGIGDHKSDRSPLQVGQFESGDEELDMWLTNLYLEGNGGGNGGESYMLAWYFAAYHTATDAWEKRNQKGVLITIGDEPVHPSISAESIRRIMGAGDFTGDITSAELLAKASEKYDVHHIHMRSTYHGGSDRVINGWKEIIGENLHLAENESHVARLIAEITLNSVKPQKASSGIPKSEQGTADSGDKAQEILS